LKKKGIMGMQKRYLGREDAPFGSEIWDVLDNALQQTAKNFLIGRRLLELEGPFGLGLKSVQLGDQETESGLFSSQVLPVMMIQETFTLGTRDLANYEREGVALDTCPLSDAVRACVHKEDDLIFQCTGNVLGLMTVADSNEMKLKDWNEIGTASGDIIEAITKLDDAGFHGPYSLALVPERFNLLFRLYPQGKQSELEHIQSMVSKGVFKSPTLKSGGIIIASTAQCASIVLGQDMDIGYIGPAGAKQEFVVTESLTLRIQQPQAICILKD
jgi:uncharacterized linocin/CFP29 family protein